MTNKDEKKNIFQRVEEFCEGKGLSQPVEFLLDIMRGVDPRPHVGVLFSLAKEVPEGELPTEDQWETIRSCIVNEPTYWGLPIDSDTSIRAAEKIMEYTHPKLKSLEVSGNLGVNVRVVPLTDDEIKNFDKLWAGEFA